MMLFTMFRVVGTVVAIFHAVCVTAILGLEDFSRLLSGGAEIYLPGTPGFENATLRWSAAAKPDIEVVVKVRTEADVQHTVR